LLGSVDIVWSGAYEWVLSVLKLLNLSYKKASLTRQAIDGYALPAA
jgi:hypothetical protein